jgi:hypothetical protein
MQPTIRDATADDFDERPAWRVRAWVGELDGKPIGKGGLAFMPGGPAVAWLEVDDHARMFPVKLHKHALAVLAEARRMGVATLVAYADRNVPASDRWLARLGFEDTGIDTEHGRIWKWSTF